MQGGPRTPPKPDAIRRSGGDATPAVVAEVHPPLVEIPEAPRRLRERARSLWEELWRSSIAQAWDPIIDVPLVERYILYFNEWLDAMRKVQDDGFTTTGSQGQNVMSPTATYIRQVETTLSRIEQQLGLTPMARARLGLTMAAGQLTAQQIHQIILGDIIDVEGEEDGD